MENFFLLEQINHVVLKVCWSLTDSRVSFDVNVWRKLKYQKINILIEEICIMENLKKKKLILN